MPAIRLGTRASTLATTQSEMVASLLRSQGLDVDLTTITTHGDTSTASLASMGGIGVFASAIRAALLGDSADIAVHSFKDLPTGRPLGLAIGAVPVREDPRDALVARDGLTLDQLPQAASVGTGSPRRVAQLLSVRPDLSIVDIRGNVDTRLGRVKGLGRYSKDGGTEDLDAVILAASGLARLGHSNVITEFLDPSIMLPAPAQGALAVECRTADVRHGTLAKALANIDDQATRLSATAERAVLSHLEAGCAAPIGALAHLEPASGESPDVLTLDVVVAAVDGSRTIREQVSVELPEEAEPALVAAHTLGVTAADELLDDGATDVADLKASGSTR
ncbi:hydroxymethylbilane synthase [Cutibacterium equinum]|uniref:Porphobilinogen deaminase n=1 Tax=Cutibacterium equinum TaxID=3016342 RepID=A0ABY7QYW7_9ACTN|nr:hydroxymethylbilane synthase [Cutibacterium equinum]WCC80227.1 hydroxymethylbilane synthase [Cutibacterium equinum]